MENKSLLEWYESINEEDEGIAKITVPVLQPDGGHPHGMSPEVPEEQGVPEVEVVKKDDDVVSEKDKEISLSSFVITKRIQDLLVRAASLAEPYETDSEERQKLVSKIQYLYTRLGENIGNL
jgi:hypothetical protein